MFMIQAATRVCLDGRWRSGYFETDPTLHRRTGAGCWEKAAKGSHSGHSNIMCLSLMGCLNWMCSTCELTSSSCTTRTCSTAESLSARGLRSGLVLQSPQLRPSVTTHLRSQTPSNCASLCLYPRRSQAAWYGQLRSVGRPERRSSDTPATPPRLRSARVWHGAWVHVSIDRGSGAKRCE
jgi:hypothetical protein